MFSDGKFEIEKTRGNWRVTVTGLPALGISIAIGVMMGLAVMAWLAKHPIA